MWLGARGEGEGAESEDVKAIGNDVQKFADTTRPGHSGEG